MFRQRETERETERELLCKLQKFLPRTSLITIYKSFIAPHVEHGGFIYDIAYNLSFNQKLESIQYNVALAITGTIRGTSREKLYYKNYFKFLKSRRWYRKLACFYKVFKTQSLRYLCCMSFMLPTLQEIMISYLISN